MSTAVALTTAEPDRNCWATPDDLFASYHARFNFTVDACAQTWNAKLRRFYSPEQNGLLQDYTGERVWCNPPYGKGLIQPWVDVALASRAELWALLLPSRTEMPWFHALYAAADLEFLDRRIHFLPPPGVKSTSPMERSFVAIVRGRR